MKSMLSTTIVQILLLGLVSISCGSQRGITDRQEIKSTLKEYFALNGDIRAFRFMVQEEEKMLLAGVNVDGFNYFLEMIFDENTFSNNPDSKLNDYNVINIGDNIGDDNRAILSIETDGNDLIIKTLGEHYLNHSSPPYSEEYQIIMTVSPHMEGIWKLKVGEVETFIGEEVVVNEGFEQSTIEWELPF